MSTRPRHILIAVLTAGLLLSGGAYAYWRLLMQGPFAGETYHDFGDVPLYNDTEKFDYTFHLTNRLGRPLTIVAIRPECGCLTVRDLRTTLQPGASFELPVTLTAKGGERIVPIEILFDDDSATTLHVKATGHPQPTMRSNVASVSRSADGVMSITFYLWTYETHDDPATPTIEASDKSLRAEFLGWDLHFRPKPADIALSPTQWTGHVRVQVEKGTELAADATITLNLPKAKPLTITLTQAETVAPTTHPTTTQP